jgi:hypothetical protein
MAWLLIPIAGEILLKLNLYNNFRQFLFIVPPLFIMAAISFDRLSLIIRSQSLALVLSAALLLPGVIAQVSLYPYQYVYYNGLVGWTEQVQGIYETDYWDTSLCQTAEYLDQTAPKGSSVALHDVILASLFRHCSRQNFTILVGGPGQLGVQPDYVVADARFPDNPNFAYFPNMPVVKSIGYGKLTFFFIRSSPK